MGKVYLSDKAAALGKGGKLDPATALSKVAIKPDEAGPLQVCCEGRVAEKIVLKNKPYATWVKPASEKQPEVAVEATGGKWTTIEGVKLSEPAILGDITEGICVVKDVVGDVVITKLVNAACTVENVDGDVTIDDAVDCAITVLKVTGKVLLGQKVGFTESCSWSTDKKVDPPRARKEGKV